MGLYNKLLEVQRKIDSVVKDGFNQSDKYKYVSSENVLNLMRPLLNEHGLLLFVFVTKTVHSEGQTKSGTTRFFLEMWLDFKWHDVDSGEELIIPFYTEGTDLAGEKSPGKAYAYASKQFFLRQFHIGTNSDDPDASDRTKSGEPTIKGTQAQAELTAMYKKAIPQMFNDLYGDDAEKHKSAYIAMTKNDNKGYVGVDSIENIQPVALPVLYSKVKKIYEKRMGKTFELRKDDNE